MFFYIDIYRGLESTESCPLNLLPHSPSGLYFTKTLFFSFTLKCAARVLRFICFLKTCLVVTEGQNRKDVFGSMSPLVDTLLNPSIHIRSLTSFLLCPTISSLAASARPLFRHTMWTVPPANRNMSLDTLAVTSITSKIWLCQKQDVLLMCQIVDQTYRHLTK